MNLLEYLADPAHVARIQKLCGVEVEKPVTCDQQTQTRKNFSSDSSDDSNCEQEEHHNLAARPPCLTGKNTSFNQVISTPNGRVTGDAGLEAHVDQLPQEDNHDIKANDHITANDRVRQRINNNDTEENKNISQTKIRAKNAFHVIEPSSRVHSKGSIFECNGHSTSNALNGCVSKDDSSSQVPPANPVVHIKYKSLLYLAHFGAFLGNEGFYLTFFPFCLWNLDGLITRQVAMLWCVVMYLGQATKDYLCWPRPPCPPVVRLETHYIQEYSMPSTHAMAGTAIPLYLAFMVVERYQVPVYVAAPIALLWFSITCWSRLYLGVHSILDLLAGFVYALLIFFSFMKYVEGYDLYQQTHLIAAPVVLLTSLALCTVCYPSTYKSSCKGDAVQIVAALAGVGLGQWMNYQLGFSQESDSTGPYAIMFPTWGWVGMALLRFVSGVFIIFLMQTFARFLSIRFFSYVYGLDKPDKTFPGVMTAYKFTTYCFVGSGITFFIPIIHLYFGIHRPSIFLEVTS
ncbi:unnamed protein product [Lymnaea stagnalis]|uniref:Phosphatidic acid phosphatase type 2/haloperoxidase domain-containing protein n=1 Tax=Lymnaea stagnalis TaxID=6523 RepID=A0AAV2IG57_LYMST